MSGLSIPDITGLSLVDAALAYAAAGWWLAPVDPGDKGKHPGSLLGIGWPFKTSRDPEQLTRWMTGQSDPATYRLVGVPSLALLHGRGSVAFDTDDPSIAPEVLRKAINECNPPFQNSDPANPDRGHALFACEPGQFGSSVAGLGKGWGEVRGVNAVTVVAPSRHAKSEQGHAYRWIRTGELPLIPDYLAECLRPPGSSRGRADSATVLEFLDELDNGVEPCAEVQQVIDRDWDTTDLHPDLTSRQWQLICLALVGHAGVGIALEDLQVSFETVATTDGGHTGVRSSSAAAGEWADALEGAVARKLAERAGVKPVPTDPCSLGADLNWTPYQGPLAGALPATVAGVEQHADFWDASPELTTIRDAALSRIVSPWAVLGGVLVRVGCCVPPSVVLPPLRGDDASINLFGGLVGPSSAGKSGAVKLSRRLIPRSTSVTQLAAFMTGTGAAYEEYTLGSGQGIAHAFGEYDGNTHMVVRRAYNVLFALDEVDHLAGNSTGNGNTLLPELRRLWMGEPLGHLYADKTRRVQIAEHDYRAGLLVGVQPGRAGVLLDDADGGLPQRFLWLPATYPHPDITPEDPEPLSWFPPEFSGLSPTPVTPAANDPKMGHSPACSYSGSAGVLPCTCGAVPTAPVGVRPRIPLPVCNEAVAEIRTAALADARGLTNPLDGHRLLARLKVAAALDILGGRAEVTAEGWQLAEVVMAVSDSTRGWVIAQRAEAERANRATRTRYDAEAAVTIDSTRESATVQRVAGVLLRRLARVGTWVTQRDLRVALASADRQRYESALEVLIEGGQVVARELEMGRPEYSVAPPPQ